MRSMLLPLLALALSPALAQAAIDFRCESENVGATLRFSNAAGSNGSILLELTNGIPYITLVDSALGAGESREGQTRFVSAPDRINGRVAALEVPNGALGSRQFLAQIKTRHRSPENSRRIVENEYSLRCARQ